MSFDLELDPKCTRTFIISPQGSTSFGQWSVAVLHRVAFFRQQREHRWLIFEPDFFEFSVSFFALLLANKEILLASNGQTSSLKALAEHYDVALLPEIMPEVPSFTPQTCYAQISESQCSSIDDTQVVSFLTSGSSGEAKKISKYWQQLRVEAQCHIQQRQAEFAAAAFVTTVSHQHIYGLLFKCVVPVLGKYSVIAPLIQFPEQLSRLTAQHKALIFISSPAYLSRVAQEPCNVQCMSSMRVIFSSGGALKQEATQAIYHSIGRSPIEIYGSTETGGIAWRQYPEIDCWQPLPRVKFRIEEQGQLAIQSPFLASKQWFISDDLATQDGLKRFSLLGRVDRIVKLEEKRLSLSQVEKVLANHPLCEQAKAFLIEGKRTQLAVVIALVPGEKLIEFASLKTIFKQYLAEYFEAVLLPRKWRFVEVMPTNSQSKTPQSMLMELFVSE